MASWSVPGPLDRSRWTRFLPTFGSSTCTSSIGSPGSPVGGRTAHHRPGRRSIAGQPVAVDQNRAWRSGVGTVDDDRDEVGGHVRTVARTRSATAGDRASEPVTPLG